MELSKVIHSSCEADCYQPLLAYIRAKKSGKFVPPYAPKCPLLPVYKLCELALLWLEAGFEKEAQELAHWLLPLESFPSLWSSDNEYNESEAKRLFSLLCDIDPVAGKRPEIDLTFLKTSYLSAAFTLDGNNTSLGAIRSPSSEIRAFGPQSGSLHFGIKGRGLNHWIPTAAYPEVWLEMKTEAVEKAIDLSFRFVGITPETPLTLAFYVKAPSCQIGEETLKPKSLRRYQGETSKISFSQQLHIESKQPHKIQVIPLAGADCFWDSDFLLQFELHPFISQASFSIF